MMSSVSLINGHIDRHERNPQKEKLIELLVSCAEGLDIRDDDLEEQIADYLLENGVVVPPCKVGDKVYKVWYTTCRHGESFPDNWSCVGCNDECDMKLTITKITVPNLRFIVENFMSGYNTVYFLTEEEAEAKLKGGVE